MSNKFEIIKNEKWLPFKKKAICDEKEIRTLTGFRPLPPQSSVSTNFTTSPYFGIAKIEKRGLYSKLFK